jgi:hypothetical protein
MSRTVTLDQLDQRVRRRANIEFASNNAAFGTAARYDDINEGIAEFWQIVGEFPDQKYYLSDVTFPTAANKDRYQIGPSGEVPIQDFWRPSGVDVSFGQNLINTARKFMWAERNRFKVLYSGWVYTQPIYYATVANSLRFIPMPSGIFNITFNYTPTSPTLKNPTDTFDGIQGFEEFVVLSAAIKQLTKQERFDHVQVLASERERVAGQMRSVLGVRDTEQCERVTDCTISDEGAFGRPVY